MRVPHNAAVADHLRRHFDIAPGDHFLVVLPPVMLGQHRHLGFGGRLGVVVYIDRVHVGLQVLQVQLVHLVRLPLVHVDGALMHDAGRTGMVHLADDRVGG